jgi:similar to stage IV sporulation protein
MFFLRLANYLAGYVTVSVHGEGPEKFINMAVGRGIFIWNVSRIGDDEVLLQARMSAVKLLRHVARKTGCRFEIRDREGLPFILARLRRRKALVIGCLFFLTALYFLSSIIWFIELRGNKNIAAADVLRIAGEAGLERGVPRRQVNIGAVEKSIQQQLPAVSWVGIEIKGTRARIEVVEKILVKEKFSGPAHVVARKAGLVEEILVLQGNPAIKEGDTVVEGQVLISGIVPPPEKPSREKASPEQKEEQKPLPPPAYVYAKGIVRARLWYESYGEAQMVEKGKRPTGRVITSVCMKISGREIILIGPRNISFVFYSKESFAKRIPAWRNLDLPVEFITLKYHEIENYTLHRNHEEARLLAAKQALAGMEKQFPAGAIILSKRVEELIVNQSESLVRVRVFVETMEEIGTARPFEPVEE